MVHYNRKVLALVLGALSATSAQSPERLLDPVVVGSPCQDLTSGEFGGVIGTACAKIEAGNIEVTVTVTEGSCLLTETHICNMPSKLFADDAGVRSYTFSESIEEAYQFVCADFSDDSTYIVAGHATTKCDSGEMEQVVSAYYEIELECPVVDASIPGDHGQTPTDMPQETTATVPPRTTAAPQETTDSPKAPSHVMGNNAPVPLPSDTIAPMTTTTLATAAPDTTTTTTTTTTSTTKIPAADASTNQHVRTGNCHGFTCGHNKVQLCHVPSGNHGNAHTLCINAHAVPAHIAHHGGDYCGPCQ